MELGIRYRMTARKRAPHVQPEPRGCGVTSMVLFNPPVALSAHPLLRTLALGKLALFLAKTSV